MILIFSDRKISLVGQLRDIILSAHYSKPDRLLICSCHGNRGQLHRTCGCESPNPPACRRLCSCAADRGQSRSGTETIDSDILQRPQSVEVFFIKKTARQIQYIRCLISNSFFQIYKYTCIHAFHRNKNSAYLHTCGMWLVKVNQSRCLILFCWKERTNLVAEFARVKHIYDSVVRTRRPLLFPSVHLLH